MRKKHLSEEGGSFPILSWKVVVSSGLLYVFTLIFPPRIKKKCSVFFRKLKEKTEWGGERGVCGNKNLRGKLRNRNMLVSPIKKGKADQG